MPASFGPFTGTTRGPGPGPEAPSGPIASGVDYIARLLRGERRSPLDMGQPIFPSTPRSSRAEIPSPIPALPSLPSLQSLAEMLGGAVARPWQTELARPEKPTVLSPETLWGAGSGLMAGLSGQPTSPGTYGPSEIAAGMVGLTVPPSNVTGRGGEWAGISGGQTMTLASPPTTPPNLGAWNALPPEATQPRGGTGPAAGSPSQPLLPEAQTASAQPAAIAAAQATTPGTPGAPGLGAPTTAQGGLQGAIAAAIAADVDIQKRLVSIEEAKQKLAEERQNLQKALSVAELTGQYEGKETLVAELRKRLVVIEEKMADLEGERIRGILAAANRGLDLQEKEGKRKHLRETAGLMGYAPPGIFAA